MSLMRSTLHDAYLHSPCFTFAYTGFPSGSRTGLMCSSLSDSPVWSGQLYTNSLELLLPASITTA